MFPCISIFHLAGGRAYMHFRCSGIEVLDRCCFRKVSISRTWVYNASFLVIRVCGLGVLDTGGDHTKSLFAEIFDLILCSTTLFANPHCHNFVVHPDGCPVKCFRV